VICHDGLSTENTKSLDCGHVFHTEVRLLNVMKKKSTKLMP